VRLCLPPELSAEAARQIALAVPDLAVEVFGFGRVPLAIGTRCYHARVHGLHKDSCRFVCGEDPDGLTVDTLDGQHFLALNGVQTLSYTCANLIEDVVDLAASGIAACRLSPQRCDMAAVAAVFRGVLDKRMAGAEGRAVLGGIYPGAPFANGFLHGQAGASYVVPS
jgi:collagenase-like PrtC family protease